MIIEYVYEQLRNDSVCDSAYEYSADYLGKSLSYYSVLKAQQREASNTVLLTLEVALAKKAEFYANENIPYFIRTRNHLLEMCSAVKNYREQKIMIGFVTYKSRR